MNKITTCLTGFLICLGASSAIAQGFTVGFGGGLASPISPKEYKDAADPGLSVGGYLHKSINENFGIRAEVGWDRVSEYSINFDTTRLAGGIQVSRPGKWEPFGFVTLGAFMKKLDLPPVDDTETDLGVSIGAGINTFFGASGTWGLGTELRLNIAMRSDDLDALKTLTTHMQIIKRF